MNKPEFWYYPIIDIFEVSKYLSELYDEDIDVLDILFDKGVYNDTYISYLIEEPEEEYSENPYETKEEWERRKKIETYLFNEFVDWDYVLFKICW